MTLDRDLVAAALPAYDIGAELGRGAWGIVLAGHHRQLGRDVAIKELPRAFGADAEVRSRFIAEARLLATLDHPHIVPIYDYVEQDGLCLLVMERLTGGTVGERQHTTALTTAEACAVTLATCAALDAAHGRGVLHRDIKPENLMFSGSGTLKVTDFGIAKVLGGTRTVATRAGEVLGTPAYMAPEQAMGADLGPATDVYATATVLYELLAGMLPFPDDDSPMAMLYKRVHDEPRPLTGAAQPVPRSLTSVVMRGLAREPESRYATAQEFGVALAEAATAEWGPGWLAATKLSVMASGPVAAATERPSGGVPAIADTVAPTAASPPPDEVPGSPAPTSAPEASPAPETIRRPSPEGLRPGTPPPERLAPFSPQRRSRRRALVATLGGVLVVGALVIALVLAGGDGGGDGSASDAPGGNESPTTTTGGSDASTTSATSDVTAGALVKLEGATRTQSGPFTVDGPWRLVWVVVREGSVDLTLTGARGAEIQTVTARPGTSSVTFDHACSDCRVLAVPRGNARYRVAVVPGAA